MQLHLGIYQLITLKHFEMTQIEAHLFLLAFLLADGVIQMILPLPQYFWHHQHLHISMARYSQLMAVGWVDE
jgi:hypothetical protein